MTKPDRHAGARFREAAVATTQPSSSPESPNASRLRAVGRVVLAAGVLLMVAAPTRAQDNED